MKMRGSSRSSGRAVPIPLEPLKEGHRMDPQERLFLEAAEKGDKHTMIRCLQGPNPVNVNSTNILGRSAIQIAVDNENIEIVEVLLKQDGIKIGDALLYAIQEGVYRIVEMLIDHPSITRDMLGTDWAKTKSPGEESSDFSIDISPVVLAAHCNQFEILQLLLSRGATIERPHTLSCPCARCREQVNLDSLRHSLRRIYTYRALASPAWISLTSSDPILTAFKLSWELEHLARKENEFKDNYNELTTQCKKYACDVLDQCRSTEEVIAVLNRESDDGSSADEDDTLGEKLTLGRLKLALKYDQKQFVSHPHCQQLLTSIWYEGLPGWRKSNTFQKVLMCIGLISLLPLMAVYYLLLPRSRLGQLLRTPFMKFLFHSASFVVFLLLLVMASTDLVNARERAQVRGPKPNQLEWLIVFWVTGFIWAECKQLWEEGLKAYVRQWWNWLDFIMLSLYLCTFSLRIVSYVQMQYGPPNRYGPLRIPRKDWPMYDPTLISEGLFAVANVFSFARMIFLFQANPDLGPLQISLGCMLIDIAKFLFIFFLVLTSFACGLNQLYYMYYFGPESEDVNDKKDDAFFPANEWTEKVGKGGGPRSSLGQGIGNSFVTLFWSLFSITNLNSTKLPDKKGYFTEFIGAGLFGTYHIVAIIVLLNMLIAMMSQSFQNIEDHADREWKFARSKLWMGYFDEGSTLPAPFNLIISPKSIYYCLRAIGTMVCKCLKRQRKTSRRKKSVEGTIKEDEHQTDEYKGHDIVQGHHGPQGDLDPPRSFGIDPITGAMTHTQQNGDPISPTADKRPQYLSDGTMPPRPNMPKYQEIMRRLVSRYIHQTKKQGREDGVNEDDILEIRQDISSLRYELREDRKREAARSSSHMDNLKRDVLRILHGGNFNLSPNASPLPNHIPPGSKSPISGGNTLPLSTSGTFLSQQEVDNLKREIIGGLRNELREISRDLACGNQRSSPVHPPALLPPINSELYHTHLYTQL